MSVTQNPNILRKTREASKKEKVKVKEDLLKTVVSLIPPPWLVERRHLLHRPDRLHVAGHQKMGLIIINPKIIFKVLKSRGKVVSRACGSSWQDSLEDVCNTKPVYPTQNTRSKQERKSKKDLLKTVVSLIPPPWLVERRHLLHRPDRLHVAGHQKMGLM
ncbi:hypothetical protein CDAR_437761 [Caerostris darwini]|uniref:Uncharacterized protein n=1 Tax=Caerostris darwini TaxID=1538125 RepID=A0AAV4NVG6_9ARAC|nr:hypothetical protein CDAR_437761 [Caerostris darwini]